MTEIWYKLSAKPIEWVSLVIVKAPIIRTQKGLILSVLRTNSSLYSDVYLLLQNKFYFTNLVYYLKLTWIKSSDYFY
ncbi:hypothetical protein KN1_03920 [Stygiolobus caldivivus]|uniref:Uncharacterized protein n=1 Tax=Stygiolobus caldivivus TaxID=2824673 RepID=A0A8D5U4T9_9CREN|nr:hypothetical protein KN1_03920 [Stygiolobus caldivivus]